MGYLRAHKHDIFVSYAHSQLNDWSKRLVEDVRKYVATGLGLREANQVDLWMDYKISGNQPLTDQLRKKVTQSGLLIVLMSEWYLESSWCHDEIEWFVDTMRQRGPGRPVFVVRVRATDHANWPHLFKDERGHALVGYDFVRATDDNMLGLPKGHPSPEYAFDSKDYYDELSKLASDIVVEMKGLATVGERDDRHRPSRTSRRREPSKRRERICLAAAAPEDVDDLRDELARLLNAQGCTVVPEINPLDCDEVHENAAEWIAGCDKFVQVLGSVSGAWRHDDAGFVMYQHKLAQEADKPIFVYRAPSVDASRVKKQEYRAFIEGFNQDDVGGLHNFAEEVTKAVNAPPGDQDGHRSVFVMASSRDESLEREIRRMLTDLDIAVFPLARSGRGAREVANVLDEGSSFLDIVRRCGAILLINGNVKEEDKLWIDGRVADIKFDIERKLGNHLPYAILDAPPDPRLEPWEDVCVFSRESPTLKGDLQGWLRALKDSARPMA